MRGICVTIILLVGMLTFDTASSRLSLPVIAAAWADDGGDGDGSSGGDDGGGDSSSDGRDGGRDGGGRSGSDVDVKPRDVIRGFQRLFRGQTVQRARPRRQAAPRPETITRPERAPNEIVARGLTSEDAAALVAQGYVVLESADLTSLATTIRRFAVPEGTSLDAARAAVRALPSGEATDFNHYYRTGQGPEDIATPALDALPCEGLHCPARALINWPERIGPMACGGRIMIGMVDTGINPDHEVLARADIDLTRITPEDYSASAAIHGTAVASILVGDPQTRVPGLVPGLPLVAVDAFHRVAGDQRADVFTLVRALDYLSERGAQVINLSLAGPPNAMLEDTLRQLTEQRKIPVIAAAGNDGPRAKPAYPAAYDNVIAVTAVDRAGTIYRRAIHGAHVEISAPGVDVWTAASVKGARWKTGTSFAAPYVTAAVALWLQHDPMLTPEEIRMRLTASARDLGPAGLDETYGYGVLNLGGLCPGQAVYLPASAD